MARLMADVGPHASQTLCSQCPDLPRLATQRGPETELNRPVRSTSQIAAGRNRREGVEGAGSGDAWWSVHGSVPNRCQRLGSWTVPSPIPLLSGSTLTPEVAPSGCWTLSMTRRLPGGLHISQQRPNPFPSHARTQAFDLSQPELACLPTNGLANNFSLGPFRRCDLPHAFLELPIGRLEDEEQVVSGRHEVDVRRELHVQPAAGRATDRLF